MIRRPPRSTRTDTRFPYTTLFRSQRFQLEVALVVLAVAAFALRALVAVRGGVDERGAVTGDVAHARRRAALLAVNALGVLAAGHLQAPRRAGELHALDRKSTRLNSSH